MIFRNITDLVFFIFHVVIIALVYITISLFFGNIALIQELFFGNYPIESQLSIFYSLSSSLYALPFPELFLFLSISILTGINMTLLIRQIRLLRSSTKLHWVVGGSTFLALATTGCASCGLPILAFLGLSGSLIYLPFKGYELSVVILGLLILSLIVLLRQIYSLTYCERPKKNLHKKY